MAAGAERFVTNARLIPIMMFKCHCRDCQQVTGGGFVAGLLVPALGFCAECGSRITGGQSDERSTGFVGVTGGSLNNPSEFRQQMDFFVSEAHPMGPNGPGNSEIRTLSAAASGRNQGLLGITST